MTSLAKGAIGLGGVGAIGGGTLAWQQGVFSSRESIRKKLISEGYKILSSSDGAWTQIFEKYKSNENEWKFKDDQINASSGTTDVQKLKDKCASALEGDADDKDEYYKAAKWCVVPRKVER
ncbi:hypothetical protein HF1_13260 [Mycoplasma haemofelis str. Langford 1]|uniref:Uncharacterized protein n=1 Tax=Mycoplasma haemofelis (strain Langford 1) TaxID=941640 RepID=E8ZJL3_MYCHL|nr:hypothetical protein HF1_13260 [Mycoplasma haemofelis str. Langford 1]